MIRRHVTALRLALMTADAASAIAVFVAVSVFRFGAEDWARQWAGAGADAGGGVDFCTGGPPALIPRSAKYCEMFSRELYVFPV